MKTPSELAPWTGDLGMKLHAHKPGASEGVTLGQIIELLNVDGSLSTGDIILRPDAAYADALRCNGNKHLREDHPALADALGFLLALMEN